MLARLLTSVCFVKNMIAQYVPFIPRVLIVAFVTVRFVLCPQRRPRQCGPWGLYIDVASDRARRNSVQPHMIRQFRSDARFDFLPPAQVQAWFRHARQLFGSVWPFGSGLLLECL